MSNIEIAQLINQRIGQRPVPFESVRQIALEIYREVGGTEDDENFEDIYAILLAILPLAHPGGSQIDDHDISTGKTWSSSKIVSELGEYATLDDVSNFLTIPNALATFPTKNDVSIYATWNAVNTSLGLKQDTLIAGDNITINNNVISASVGESPDMSNYYTKDEVDASLATKADTSDLDIYIKFVSLSQTDYNSLPSKDVSTLYLTNDRNKNYLYIGNILVGGTTAILTSSAYLQYMTTDSLILWPTALAALPTIIRNTYGSIFEYGGMEFSSYTPSIRSIGDNAFLNNQTLSRFIIPDTVTTVSNNAFNGCSQLVYIDLGSGVKTIGLEAFKNTALTEITFPISLTSIGQQSFANCTSLNNITYRGTIAEWETVTKGANWHEYVPATVVHCTDGDVAI